MPATISIGMPVRNGDRFLEQALDSLLAQDFEDFEVIISDNASEDRTEAIARAYAARDRRISYTRSPTNRGAAWNFNHVFQLASGQYFHWAAHDDYLDRSFLSRCVAKLQEDRLGVLSFATMAVVDHEGRLIRIHEDRLAATQMTSADPRVRFHHLLWHLRDCHPVFGLIRSEALRQTGLILNCPEPDRLLLGELSLLGRIHQVTEPLFFRRSRRSRDGWLWLHPGNVDRPRLTLARLTYWHLRAIQRSPSLRPANKIVLAADLIASFAVRRSTARWRVFRRRGLLRASRRKKTT